VEVMSIVLHVGPGTFRPVMETDISRHRMEAEYYRIPPQTAQRVNDAHRRGGRVYAVGTTTARALESAVVETRGSPQLGPGEGWTELFIFPPFVFRITDALITNFHLPGSTLLMLVSAFAGRELILRAYREAIDMRYLFYSYGDAMLILRGAVRPRER
jgi:S-adenosylmethionine:tRNA ribosyltransferase-isomerase